jgi:carboxymethylenebutenolidase
MSGRNVDVQTPDGVADSYLAIPDDGETHPGVLLVMDAFGLRPQLEKMADRISARGFTVLAPNFYYRSGRAPLVPTDELEDPDKRGALFERIRPLMASLTPERVASDGGAYITELERVASAPIAITGYCMGGRVGWRIATTHPEQVAALAGFHAGGLVTDEPDSPHLSAGELSAELYFGHADNDPSMTAENVATLEQALSDAGRTYTSELYEGASHGYTMADSAVYDEAAAERHYQALFDLLDRTYA